MTTIPGATLAHDARGNITFDGAKTFAYDADNRLITATQSGQATVNQTYDPAGRLYQSAGTATTRFLYDGVNVIGEYDGSGTLLRRHAHGPGADEPLVWYEGSGTSDRRFLHADPRGSVIAVANSSGTVTAKNKYDAYGAPAAGNQGRFQYTGQIWLAEAGLYHYKARAYHPGLGRFLQTDPIGYGDGLNLYAYVGNDPVNATDPSGLRVWVTIPIGIGPHSGAFSAGNGGSGYSTNNMKTAPSSRSGGNIGQSRGVSDRGGFQDFGGTSAGGNFGGDGSGGGSRSGGVPNDPSADVGGFVGGVSARASRLARDLSSLACGLAGNEVFQSTISSTVGGAFSGFLLGGPQGALLGAAAGGVSGFGAQIVTDRFGYTVPINAFFGGIAEFATGGRAPGAVGGAIGGAVGGVYGGLFGGALGGGGQGALSAYKLPIIPKGGLGREIFTQVLEGSAKGGVAGIAGAGIGAIVGGAIFNYGQNCQ